MHWADVIAEELLKKGGKHRIATGISPSGPIHLGNLREMLTADAIRRALVDAGGEAEMVYIADDFDPLRRKYPFLPDEYEDYIGKPLSRIPDPEGCHDSYSEHFLQPFLEALEVLAIPVTVYRASKMYGEGLFEEKIRLALNRRDDIAAIISEVTGRKMDDDWYPFMPVCQKCGRINTTKVVSFDEKSVEYKCECGDEGRVDYREGKLTWRVDWAARWQLLNITCEPFGKDHAAAGGSYDTGKRLAQEIFNYPPPYPVPYEWIHLKGKGAMKSSKGVGIPVREMVEILPPEIIRYVIIRVRPERHIEFDPGMGLLDVIDEFESRFFEGDRSVQLSLVGDVEYSEVPFRHLIVVGQIAGWDTEKTIEILKRTGYEVNERVKKDVERRLRYARKWIEKYAPDRIRFEVLQEPPELELSDEERKFVEVYSERLRDEMSPEEIHTLVYDVAKEIGIKPAKAFQVIYKAILGKSYGPRVGYFIKSLGVEWVKRRFEEVLRSV